jgi:hypothetical protein
MNTVRFCDWEPRRTVDKVEYTKVSCIFLGHRCLSNFHFQYVAAQILLPDLKNELKHISQSGILIKRFVLDTRNSCGAHCPIVLFSDIDV